GLDGFQESAAGGFQGAGDLVDELPFGVGVAGEGAFWQEVGGANGAGCGGPGDDGAEAGEGFDGALVGLGDGVDGGAGDDGSVTEGGRHLGEDGVADAVGGAGEDDDESGSLQA